MIKTYRKLLAALIAVLIMLGMVSFSASADAADLKSRIEAIGLTVAEPNPTSVVTVSGSATTNTALDLDITGVTVRWQADLSSAIGPASSYLLNIRGNGTFEVSGSIISTGTGGTMRVTGGAAVEVKDGGSVSSSRGGYAILVDGNNVMIDVNSGGSVISMDGNGNAAVQVGSGSAITGTVINVNGGSVISVGSGYAINDGAGTGVVGNDTEITVSGGAVTAGGNCAIHSTGRLSTVTIDGGVVTNAAGNNLNPTIDMVGEGSGAPGSYNISINNAVVQSTSLNGYTLQTKGDLIVQGNSQVIAQNGRAINLVGTYSTATIAGGLISGAGINVISTATTTPGDVTNAKVIVNGGTVSSTSTRSDSNTINITGVQGEVIVRGGVVSAIGGNAINADTGLVSSNALANHAASFNIIVAGGSVSSKTGYAIQNLGQGAGAAVTVSDKVAATDSRNAPGGQVSVLRDRAAIRCPNGTVTVNGGFVFSYYSGSLTGDSAAKTAISAQTGSITWPDSNGGQVGVWNLTTAAGRTTYDQGTPTDLELVFGTSDNLHWYFNPRFGSGLDYKNGFTAGFFPLSEVTITIDHGLIFDVYNGNMYKDTYGNGVKGDLVTVGRNLFDPTQGAWWPEQVPGETPALYRLVLNGFSWTTTVPRALTIVDSSGELIPRNATIITNGNSIFASTDAIGAGITIEGGLDITIAGSGTLVGRGNANDGVGLDIGAGQLFINSGTLVAQGGLMAIHWPTAGPIDKSKSTGMGTGDLSVPYYRWKWSAYFDGREDGTPGDSPAGKWNSGTSEDAEFVFFYSDLYVMLQALDKVQLDSAVQIGGVSGITDSIGIVLTFSKPVSGLTANDITISNETGSAVKGVLLTGNGTTWTIELLGVKKEGTVTVTVNQDFGGFFLEPNYRRGVDVYKGPDEDDSGENTRPEPPPPPSPGKSDVSHLLNAEDHMQYIRGIGKNLFSPDRNMTRAEVAQMFFNLLVEQNVEITNRFPDEPDDAWHERAVHTLASMGILTGYPDGGFHPEDSITRAEFVAIAARFAEELPEAVQTMPFFDVSVQHWGYKYISAAVRFGWIKGYEDGSFQPNRLIRRAEAVTIVNRMLDRVADREYIDNHAGLDRFTDVPETHWAYYDIMEAFDSHDYERHDGKEEWTGSTVNNE